MPSKRQVLDLLPRDELVELVGRYNLLVRDGKAQLADMLDGHRPALPELLAGISCDRLKELCRGLGLGDGSREKAAAAAAGRSSACSPLGAESRPEDLEDEPSGSGFERLQAFPRPRERLDLRTESMHALQSRRAADAHVELR
ncbi:hypothetical protein WME97_27095 [Sorangium sp. So ce367]|uniref:hypothetical protein n=1 Tax=Sorangium sp. So ce367 TaxID=3133305 RepID=UPI003F5F5134